MGAVARCSFDRVAPFYPAIEFVVFGHALSRARNGALRNITPRSRILLLGEGNGRFLVELLSRYPHALVTCVEPSEGMRKSQRERLLRQFGEIPANLTTEPCRIEDWKEPVTGFDVVVAHFFLDLFVESELEGVVARINQVAGPGARICIAEFSEESRFSSLSRVLIRTMYLFFSIVSHLKTERIPEWRSALVRAGWSEQSSERHLGGLVRSSVWGKTHTADTEP